VLTHCNAGALATCGYGTALGVIRAAIKRGHKISVFADETRPFLQGARLTAWELMKDSIPTTVICDNMAAALMRQAASSGARRLGPHRGQRRCANKIALRRRGARPRARIPFYVAAPCHHRPCHQQRRSHPHRAARPERGDAHQRQADDAGRRGDREPAFDVTPAKYWPPSSPSARAARALCGVNPRHGDQPAPRRNGARVGRHRPPSFFLADPHGTWSDSGPAGRGHLSSNDRVLKSETDSCNSSSQKM